MQPAIDRIMMTYDLLLNRSAAASAEARVKVTEYVQTLFEAGEKDMHRLTVCGLTYLRELDGSSDPVKAGGAAISQIEQGLSVMTPGGRPPGVSFGVSILLPFSQDL